MPTDSERAQIARSELRFRAVIDGFADPLLMVDEHLLVRYANGALTRALEHRSADVLARPFGLLLHPDERAAVEGRLAEALLPNGSTPMLEHHIRGANGEWEIAETTANQLDDPTGRALLVLHVRLVTARKRGEEALRRSEARLQQAQRVAHVGSWEADLESRELSCSDELLRITEVEATDPRVVWSALCDTVHPDDREIMARAREAALRDRRPYQLALRLLMADGRVKHVEVQQEIELAANGRALRSRGTVQDVTERVHLEARLQQRQKMETVGQLAGGIAHDFNNLLTVINGTAEISLSELPQGSHQREAWQTIHEAGTRAAALTQQLLAFGRKQILRAVTLSLATAVARLDRMLQRLIGQDVTVVIRNADDLGLVSADPTQIDQVILNLAINARDAMPSGGTLTIETANVMLDEAHARTHDGVQTGPHVVLTVSDTGSGMDAATLARMFEPFFTTKGAGQGSGLGLAMVYGIVRQSGGDIWCYSEPGKGTVVKIFLPRVDNEAPRRAGPPTPPAKRGGEKILVVDDDEGLRRVARRILEKRGFVVIVASDGEEALRLLDEHEGIDLVVTDVVMPGMGGRELGERLAVLRPDLKVLFASGYTEDAILHHGVLHEGAAFIMKPYTLQTLPDKVRELLDG